MSDRLAARKASRVAPVKAASSLYHLDKVFLKLDITSRKQLSRIPASHLNTA
jgi:hypothetical protein